MFYSLVAGTFLLYTAMSSLGFIFVFILLPETKNRTLDETTQLFDKSVCSYHEKSDMGYVQKYNKVVNR